jgi:tetratricopeptide (TPR) repeat protein
VREGNPRGYAVLLILLLGVLAAPARGSEESQALSARGLIELNAGHTKEALELFNKAVAADPSDPDVRYQRGAVRANQGDNAGAIEDMRAALAARPNFPAAALVLGVALADSGQYDAAEPWLLQAQPYPDLDAQASFMLGVTQLHLNRLDDAERNFARAQTRDPSLAVPIEYYEGVIAYRRNDIDTAETHFTAVENTRADSAIGRESTQFLSLIRRGRRANYSAFGRVALEYDSNVTLGPATNVAQGITGEGDGRFVINVGGRYVPLSRGGFTLALGYEFFQSLQFHLTDFNLQDHRPALQLTYDFGPVLAGVLGRYDYYLLGGESFLSEVTAFPWVAIREPIIGRTEIYYRMQRRDYKDANTSPAAPPPADNTPFDVLDGYYNFAGVRQVVPLGSDDRELSFGYQLGFNSMFGPGSDQYQYGAQEFEVALRWLLPYAVTAQAGYRYEHQDYAPQSAELSAEIPPEIRRDNDHRIIVAFERPLTELYEHLFVNAAWYGTFNDSNNVLFEYTRQIGSIGAEVRF